jgi:hypothetical protein
MTGGAKNDARQWNKGEKQGCGNILIQIFVSHQAINSVQTVRVAHGINFRARLLGSGESSRIQ